MATIEKKARFDTRISKEQKLLLERAAQIGGYRSLSDFMVLTAQQRAKEIIEERERVIVSQRDSEFFFDAITNPVQPNNDLISAATEYQAQLNK